MAGPKCSCPIWKPLFVCRACGIKGAEVRPDFNWNDAGPVGGTGYRRIADH